MLEGDLPSFDNRRLAWLLLNTKTSVGFVAVLIPTIGGNSLFNVNDC